jgi:hypothetical protein
MDHHLDDQDRVVARVSKVVKVVEEEMETQDDLVLLVSAVIQANRVLQECQGRMDLQDSQSMVTTVNGERVETVVNRDKKACKAILVYQARRAWTDVTSKDQTVTRVFLADREPLVHLDPMVMMDRMDQKASQASEPKRQDNRECLVWMDLLATQAEMATMVLRAPLGTKDPVVMTVAFANQDNRVT